MYNTKTIVEHHWCLTTKDLTISEKKMTKIKILAAMIFALSPVSVYANNHGEALAKKSGCLACHAVDKQVVGPSYQAVAKKYKGNAKAEAMLISKVKNGGAGVWGQIPMPPHAHVPEADIKAIVTWVLKQ